MFHSIICFSCLLTALLFTQALAQRVNVQYSELQELNVSCSPRDTCKEARQEDDLSSYNCHCGPYCVQFDSCCVDSKFRGLRLSNMILHSCARLNYSHSLYMVDFCKRGWNGEPYVKDMCLGNGEALSDPMLVIPATNAKTGTTYKNYFCAACNDDNLDDVTIWNVRITRYGAELPESDLHKLKYNIYTWEIHDGDNEPERVIFHQEPPPHVAQHVKTCRREVIGSCAPSWRNDVIRRKCASYTAMVSFDYYRDYKNIHCAICNMERNISSMSCAKVYPSGSGSGSGSGGDRRPLSFAMLLDVNRSDGDRVGEVQICKDRELFDPFFKKCRALSCALPGQRIKDGKCVRD